MGDRPNCFGILDEVFPVGSSGIREVKEKCIDCPYRLECLKSALDTEEGIRMREEMLRRVPVNGMGDWLKRWSEKKMLAKELQKREPGLGRLIWTDFKRVIFSPRSFFLGSYDGGLRNAFIFGVITGSVGSMFSLFWKLLILADRFPSVLSMIQESSIGAIHLMIFLSFLLVPLVVVAGILIYSFIIHLSLSIFGAAKGNLKGTISVVCYSQAPELFSLVPMLGSMIGFIWRIYIQIVGLRYIHRTTYLRVITSFAVPLFLFVGFIMVVMKTLYHMLAGVLS